MSDLNRLSQLFRLNELRRYSNFNMTGHNRRSYNRIINNSTSILSLAQRQNAIQVLSLVYTPFDLENHQPINQSVQNVQDIICKIDPDDQKDCPICFCEFKKTNIFIPKCGHKICGDCFFQNIYTNRRTGKKCSICRQIIVPSNIS